MPNFYEGVNYKLWSVFNGVDELMLENIVLLHIIGSDGRSAIFVTREDQVFGVGVNVSGFLGLGCINGTDIPIPVDILCGKYVIGFASGSTHSVAYTKEGELYSWGDNTLGKLGNGTIISRDSPGRVLLPEGVKVLQAACSDRYTAALTSEFKVLQWGDIDWNSSGSQTLPIYLEFFENVRINSLCFGALHATALTSKGEIYTWGCGDLGQLGQGRIPDVDTVPRKIEGNIIGLQVQQVACTLVATVVLIDDGRVFAWGHNRNGVLGVALDFDTIPSPQQVQIQDIIKSIAAANMGDIILAMSENKVYKWGKDEITLAWNINFPFVIQLNHILDAFSESPTPRFERSLEGGDVEDEDRISKDYKGVIRDIGSIMYNNKEYSDLVLRLSDGVIYVHKLILRNFCEHFKSMLDGSWSENDKKEINLTDYNSQAYRAFVKYIYTGKLDNSLNGTQLIALCDIAESYLEHHLKKMVISKFVTNLTVDNAAELYGASISQSCQKLNEICCDFISLHLEEVILTEGFEKLEANICKTLVRKVVQLKRDES